ncbi:MAG TPA: DUF3854 domain-containing protein, partial [Anaerolineales bacterium]|nr:DUF3854 domain-containing protein [Anaerolineales bacterium]
MTNTLSQPHHDSLRASTITDEVIAARGYRTVTEADELRKLGFAPNQCRVPGLLLPLHTTDGQVGLNVYRPDNPRVVEDRRKTNPDGTHPVRVMKYELPKNAGVRLDCPPNCHAQLANPAIPLWITEGQKKADALVSAGMCAIALLGVWNFVGKNEYGGITFLADWQYIALNDREVHIIFDSDLMTKHPVRQALERITQHLQRKGAHVSAVYLPQQVDGSKAGVDDWLAAGHRVEELGNLLDTPRPAPKPADPLVEILDSTPSTISRPLTLINGHGYAATWLYVKTTRTESLNRQGEVIRHDPPQSVKTRRLFIIRSDGAIFGEGADHPIEELGIDIHLPEMPMPEKLWSSEGVRKYRKGNRPVPVNVFAQIVNVIGYFIDFDRSISDQRTMAECLACYVLSTWFLDAFTVTGFIWPNGDKGSGKTNLITIVAEMAYLGQVILAGGSFASLRDMADYGATLAFDDAENLSDPRKTDPDKRTLLLAGNRRGAKISVKEMSSDRTWHIRYVNAFCPRLFSAIRLPDPVLASRTIIIPLIRTSDRSRANIDPLDYSAWPCNHAELLDDLWALALANISDISRHDTAIAKLSRLAGRQLQPWRAILAVAAWLEEKGVAGLFKRLEELSVNYQSERSEFESSDMTTLVIKAIIEYAVTNSTSKTNVANAARNPEWTFTTSSLTDFIKQLAGGVDDDLNPEHINSQRIGHVLRRLRLPKPNRPRGQKSRLWKITYNLLN